MSLKCTSRSKWDFKETNGTDNLDNKINRKKSINTTVKANNNLLYTLKYLYLINGNSTNLKNKYELLEQSRVVFYVKSKSCLE